MTIKELFKKVETANEISMTYNSYRYYIGYEYDNHYYDKFFTFNAFKRFLKREYFDCFINSLLKENIELNETMYFTISNTQICLFLGQE